MLNLIKRLNAGVLMAMKICFEILFAHTVSCVPYTVAGLLVKLSACDRLNAHCANICFSQSSTLPPLYVSKLWKAPKEVDNGMKEKIV